MPIYEYRCESCGHELEKLQKLADAPLTDCPACGKPDLKKKISAAGFRLKGGGWYETDFKQANKKNLHEGGQGKDGETKGGDAKGGESKGEGASGGEKKTTESKPSESKPKPASTPKPAASSGG